MRGIMTAPYRTGATRSKCFCAKAQKPTKPEPAKNETVPVRAKKGIARSYFRDRVEISPDKGLLRSVFS